MNRTTFKYTAYGVTDTVYAVADTFAVRLSSKYKEHRHPLATALNLILAEDTPDADGMAGEVLLTVNVNISDVPEDCLAVKTWERPENFVPLLLEQRLIEGPVVELRSISPFVQVHIYKKGPALLELEAQRHKDEPHG
jgi:hypothetical protein